MDMNTNLEGNVRRLPPKILGEMVLVILAALDALNHPHSFLSTMLRVILRASQLESLLSSHPISTCSELLPKERLTVGHHTLMASNGGSQLNYCLKQSWLARPSMQPRERCDDCAVYCSIQDRHQDQSLVPLYRPAGHVT